MAEDDPLRCPCVCPWCLRGIRGPRKEERCLGCGAARPGLLQGALGWPKLEGVCVDGKYTLEARIWENLGAVFRVCDPAGQPKALKVLAGKYRGTTLEQEFKREIKNHTGLSVSSLFVQVEGHSNLYGPDKAPCGMYVLMEWVPWPTLDTCIPLDVGMAEGDAVRIAIGILEAVKLMHEKGLLHHDLKPRNVFVRVDAEGRIDVRANGEGVKVGDLGVASHRGRVRTTMVQVNQHGAFGTTGYMSPERLVPIAARTANVDERADLWAVGAILWEMVTGAVPFDEGITPGNMRSASLPVRATMSAGLCAVLVKALEHDPADRFANAEEFLTALRGLRRGWHGEEMPEGMRRAEETEHTGQRYYWCDDRAGGEVLMAYVRPGTFWRGSDEVDNEKPLQRVTVAKGFYVGVYPVTVEEYGRFVAKGKNGVMHRAPKPTFEQAGAHPVVNVSWHDAMAYAVVTGLRLLTEAEWEYAARGALDGPYNKVFPKGRRYPWGDAAPDDMLLWWNHSDREPEGTCPVGQHPAGISPFGVHDLSGNVWEWVAGREDSCANLIEMQRGGLSDGGTATGIRGGGWSTGESAWVRAAVREWHGESHRFVDVGFRIARDAL